METSQNYSPYKQICESHKNQRKLSLVKVKERYESKISLEDSLKQLKEKQKEEERLLIISETKEFIDVLISKGFPMKNIKTIDNCVWIIIDGSGSGFGELEAGDIQVVINADNWNIKSVQSSIAPAFRLSWYGDTEQIISASTWFGFGRRKTVPKRVDEFLDMINVLEVSDKLPF